MPQGEGADDGEFARRVLDEMPTPIVVVDQFGAIVYGNACMAATMNITLDEARGRNIMEFIHPDDLGWAVDAFLALSAAGHDSRTAHEPWAALPIKAIGEDGEPMHVEITGANALHDELIDGFVYEVRHGGEHHLLRQVLTGLASDLPVDELIQLVADMIAAPPVRLQVAIVEVAGGHTRIVGSTGPDVVRVLGALDLSAAPWRAAGVDPSQIEVGMLDEPFRTALADAGFGDWMHVAVGHESTDVSYRVVALAPYHHVPATGVLHRLARATEVIKVIQIRAVNDALLARRARHDALTDLPNRRGLTEILAAAPPPIAVLYVDLDRFKPVNDQHGHATGDHVLLAAASRMERAVRPCDVVARIGGDEFAIVLTGGTTEGPGPGWLVRQVADRVLHELCRPVHVNGAEIDLSASIGIAVADPADPAVPAVPAVAFDVLLDRADAAMYEAKRAGGRRAHG